MVLFNETERMVEISHAVRLLQPLSKMQAQKIDVD